MKLAIMQPYFFPYIGYFQLINAVDKYILYDNLNYIYQGWVDRNRIADKKGNVFYVRPQVEGASVNKKIYEINISANTNWKKKALKTISLTYSRSPYFSESIQLFEDLFCFETESLAAFNINSIIKLSKYLGIDTQIVSSRFEFVNLEDILSNNTINLQEKFSDLTLDNYEVKVVRAVKMCLIEGADTFINAIGGQNLYSKKDFINNGINLKFIKTNAIEYNQFFNQFISNLSIIDVLMHNGQENTKKLIKEYELI